VDGEGTQTFVNLVNDQLISNSNHNLSFTNSPGAGVGHPEITIMDSTLVGSPGQGIVGVLGNLLISNSMIANNSVGVDAGGGSSILLNRTQLFGNGTSWQGNVQSYGNNPIDQSGPPTISL
jgi:hypothetical protein